MGNRNLTRKCVTGFPNGKREVSQLGNTRLILVFSQPYSGGRGDVSHLKSADMASEKCPFLKNMKWLHEKHMFYNGATNILLMIFIFVNDWKYPWKSVYHWAAYL